MTKQIKLIHFKSPNLDRVKPVLPGPESLDRGDEPTVAAQDRGDALVRQTKTIFACPGPWLRGVVSQADGRRFCRMYSLRVRL